LRLAGDFSYNDGVLVLSLTRPGISPQSEGSDCLPKRSGRKIALSLDRILLSYICTSSGWGRSTNMEQKPYSDGCIINERYQIDKLLGMHAAGCAYLCLDLRSGKTKIRLKVLNADKWRSGPTDLLSGELSLLSRMRHPNLVRILDFGVLEDSGHLFLAEEWVEGNDACAATEGMDLKGVLSLISVISGALAFLHTRGIVHGYLNPSSAIVRRSTNSTELKLMDFGLAHRLPSMLRDGSFRTLAYAAPELHMGGAATPFSDLYSLGVLVYRLITRRLPFEDEDLGFLIQKQLQASVDLRPIENLDRVAGLSQLVCRLLDKEPANRPAASEILTFLSSNILGHDDSGIGVKELGSYISASKFVGREMEMGILRQRAGRVRRDHRGWTVFVLGEAGSGKTRCLDELKSWALLESWRVIEGACRKQEDGPYGPYRQILARTGPGSGESIFQFNESQRVPEPGTFESSSEFAAGQFRDMLTRELVRRLRERPTLLLLHDFHLADAATCAVLDYLSSDIQAHPIFMCVSIRSGEEHRGALSRAMDLTIRQERGEVLHLEPLVKQDVEQLVAGIMGDNGLKQNLGKWMFGSIGGNPFFLEEMLKHLIEQGLLRRELKRWRFLDQELLKLKIPATVRAVLRHRVSQLSPMALALARWLALLRRPVLGNLLHDVSNCSGSDLAEALQDLRVRQMIRVETKDGIEHVELCHDLVAEAILERIPKAMQRKMHSKIAEVLSGRGADSNLQELALHSMEGRAGVTAVRYALALGSESHAQFAHERALHCFQYVIRNRGDLTGDELCQAAIEASDTMFALGLPKPAMVLLKSEMRRNRAIRVELKTRMLMQLALAYQHLSDFRSQEACCRKGLGYFRGQPDTQTNATKAMLWAQLAYGAILQSRLRRGMGFLDRALKSCPDPNSGALAARIHGLASYLYRMACKLKLALMASQKAADILCKSQDAYLTCSVYSTHGLVLMGLGRFSLALEIQKQAVFMSEKSRSIILRSQALGNTSECLLRMGNIPEAIVASDLAAECVAESNNPAITFAFNTILAEIRCAAGDYEKTIKILNWLRKNTTSNLAMYASGHAHYVAATVYFLLGDFEVALEHIETLLKTQTREAPFYESALAQALKARICCEHGKLNKGISQLSSLEKYVTRKHWPYQMCVIKLYLAEVLIKGLALGPAEKLARDALRLAKGMRAMPLVAQSHYILGLLHAAANKVNGSDNTQLYKAIQELQSASSILNPSFPTEMLWRVNAELAFLFRKLPDADRASNLAQKASDFYAAAEKTVPSGMLTTYRRAFDRDHLQSELVPIIEAGREQRRNASLAVAEIHNYESSRILLRVSTAVNSIPDLNTLLEEILDQLITAVGVERAFVFLRDASTGRLHQAQGRNLRKESLLEFEGMRGSIVQEVCDQGSPIVSADARSDPRAPRLHLGSLGNPGRIFCAPLKVSDRILGVLYADHSAPADNLSESTINLFAAFCNLAAIAIENALAHQLVAREKSELEQYVHNARDGYPEIVGKSAAVEALRDRIGLAADSPLDILIIGESGTGKELVARAIHRTGRRKMGKFIAVDCGALTDNLAEAEFFGYRKGAFTGAVENRQGLLESANGGIVFFDEISNLSFQLQAKLLRVLQEREVRRIGETSPRSIDIQVIAASNKDLLEEMQDGRFRSDLYYRLKAMEIRVPPLRNRSEDIPLLVEWYLEQIAQSESGRSKKLSLDAWELLKNYHYPGNVRELKNIAAQSYYSGRGILIGIEELPSEVRHSDAMEYSAESVAASRLYNRILAREGNFEELVRKPFGNRQFGASLVKGVIERALKDTRGRYRDAFVRLGIPDRHYSVTMQFLKRNNCYVDFRPFRRTGEG
jgi:transcriptional regulator with GAF, ATPase, and Fis domain